MNKLAVIDVLNRATPTHILPVMLALGPKRCVYYCDSGTMLKNASFVKILAKNGFKIVADDYQKAREHTFFMADWWTREGNSFELWRAISAPPMRGVYYIHSTDSGGRPGEGDCLLYSSERQFVTSMGQSTFMRDEQDRLAWGVNDNSGEGVIVGTLQLAEWATRRHSGKDVFKKMLAEEMRVEFDPSLPLVVYFHSEVNLASEMDKGLKLLADAGVSLIVKGHSSLKTERSIYRYEDPLLGSHMLRFAADCTIAGYSSGLFSTSVMLGLHTIPVYTKRIDSFGCCGLNSSEIEGRTGQRFLNFNTLLGKKNIASRLCAHIPPFDIMDTDRIMERIHDREYWARYDAEIQSVQRSVFGHYYLDDAHIRAAKHICHLLDHGTMLLPEIAELNKTETGVLDPVYPCSVLL